MFESPRKSEVNLHFKPGVYLATLKRLEDGGEGTFGPRIKWVFNLFNTGKNDQGYEDATIVIPIYGADGDPYEYFARTSTKFGKNPKTKKVAAARMYSEALIGRAIEDDEDPQAIEKTIVGKKAVLHIVANEGTDGNTYMNIEFMEPYKKGMLAPIIAEPEDAFADDDAPGEPVGAAAGASSSNEEMPW